LQSDAQALQDSFQIAAARAGLSDPNLLYDALLQREVTARPGGARVTPELFQAAALRVGAPWLSQAGVTSPLSGARLMDRAAAEQVLEAVAGRLPGEPLGTLAGSILIASREASEGGASAFWERVGELLRR
jgi:hypothetical protein